MADRNTTSLIGRTDRAIGMEGQVLTKIVKAPPLLY